MTRDAEAERKSRALRRRRRWQQRYRPDRIKLLLIAEAPPSSLDRYFYFPRVSAHDSLFRYVCRSLLGSTPDRDNKAAALDRLRAAGVFLIDADEDPIIDRLRPDLNRLVRRIARLDPEHVVLIKASVYDRCFQVLTDAGLPTVDVRVPFPGSGQQRRFELAFAKVRSRIRWHQPAASANPGPSIYMSTGEPEPEIPGGCRINVEGMGRTCLNPGRHDMSGVITCTTHRKAIERAALGAST